jgi:teichuronic acid biosynthesis protein TuaE
MSLNGNLKILIVGIVLTLIVSALVGLFLFSEKLSTILFLILVSSFSILSLLLFSPSRERIFLSLQIIFLYLAIIAGFLGPAFLSVSVGPFHLFPYRILLIILWLLFIVNFLLKKGSIGVEHLKVKNFLNFLLLWFLYAVLSLVWAVDKSAALREVVFLFVNISMVFFIIFYLSELNLLKKLYFLWLMVFAIFIPIAFFEVFTGQHLSVSKLASTTHPKLAFLPTTFFYNPNDFATYLVLSLPFFLTLIRYKREILTRLIGGLAFFAGVFLLFSTRSRANLFAFLVGLILWYFFLLEKK